MGKGAAGGLLLLLALLFPASALPATGAPACAVFLVPGAFGEGTSSRFLLPEDYFADYVRFFTDKGCLARKIEFPPDGTVELRARLLRDQVEKHAPPRATVFLLGHSQGGLDARFALRANQRSKLMPAIRALATVGSPHAGTPVAGWAVAEREHPAAAYWFLKFLGYDLQQLPFAGELTPEFLARHREEFAEVPGIRYGAARAICRQGCHWALRGLAWFAGVPPGDGMVGGESQRFGEDLGEYDLDHLSEVNADGRRARERDRLLAAFWEFFRKDLH